MTTTTTHHVCLFQKGVCKMGIWETNAHRHMQWTLGKVLVYWYGTLNISNICMEQNTLLNTEGLC